MAFVTEIGTDLKRAAALLRGGDVVAIPTETVYGLAANALDEEAVVKIFHAKDRPFFDPLIVHVHDQNAVSAYVSAIPKSFEPLMDAFWPGPLTLLFPKAEKIPDITTSGLTRVGIRVPAHPMVRELLNQIDFPLAAPSANPFGYISPTTALHVYEQLQNKIPYILDGGPSTVGLESTIVGEENGELAVYRLGGIGLEELEKVAGTLRLRISENSNPAAPGQLASHYAPQKNLLVGDVYAILPQFPEQKIAVISFRKKYNEQTVLLSPNGDLKEAARALFHVLRQLDQSDADLIVAEVFPDYGLGRAINDRLRRAAVR
ncbi:MAG: L-threonylcarbamoyladenylate synthase [Chitinophagales bacterium]